MKTRIVGMEAEHLGPIFNRINENFKQKSQIQKFRFEIAKNKQFNKNKESYNVSSENNYLIITQNKIII